MALVPFEVKLARFRAVKRHPRGRAVCDYDVRRKKATAKKRALVYGRRAYRALKRADRDELRYVLAMARALLGYKYKPGPGMKGKKLTPEHLKALARGRNGYIRKRAKRKAQYLLSKKRALAGLCASSAAM